MAVGNASITEVDQIQYQQAVIESLARNKGTALMERCIVQNCKGNKETVFNRVDGVAISETGNFAEGNFTSTAAARLDLTENVDYTLGTITVKPSSIFAGNYVHEDQYNQTMVNLDQVIIQAQIDALNIARDKRIVKAIAKGIQENDAYLLIPQDNYYGDATTELTATAFVEAMEIARLMLGSGERLTVISDKSAIAKIKMDKDFTVLSQDFKDYFGFQTPGSTNMATGSIITWRHDILDECMAAADGGNLTDTATVGRMLIMVEKAVGIATWGDSVSGSISYHDTISKYFLKSKISIGASLLDPYGIFVIEYKKPTAPVVPFATASKVTIK